MNTLGNVHVIPVIAPYDSASTVTEAMTDAVNIGEAQELEFDVSFGTITGDTLVIKAYKDANAVTASGGVAIAFKYKKSSAVGTDVMGDWTACADTGVTITAGDDGKMIRIAIDPALCDGYPYVYLGIDPGPSMSVLLQSVIALAIPRYSQEVVNSMVD